MKPENLIKEAYLLQEELMKSRRFLHTHPGIGFDIQETTDYVFHQLLQIN